MNTTDHLRAVASTSFVLPSSQVSEDMIRRVFRNHALPYDAWHIAAKLNAMMQHGYCAECGLTPNGCAREECGQNVPALAQSGGEKTPTKQSNS